MLNKLALYDFDVCLLRMHGFLFPLTKCFHLYWNRFMIFTHFYDDEHIIR